MLYIVHFTLERQAQSGTLQKYGLGGTGPSAEEAGPVCVICREGYKLQPTKVSAPVLFVCYFLLLNVCTVLFKIKALRLVENLTYAVAQILCAYTFTKRCNVEEFELGKQYKTTGYSTVSFFNLIHLDCHHNALRYEFIGVQESISSFHSIHI